MGGETGASEQKGVMQWTGTLLRNVACFRQPRSQGSLLPVPRERVSERVSRRVVDILGNPGADSGGEGKSKRAGKYGTKKSKERREEPLGTMSYQTSSKRSPSFWLLIGARKLLCFSAQSEGGTAATIWKLSGKTLSPGALLAVLYFSSCHIFFRPFRLFLVPTICPWVSEDG